MTESSGPSRAVWFTGLPGSGKSSISRKVSQKLEDQGLNIHYLQMDQRRKVYFPDPDYSSRERKQAYSMFAREAAQLAGKGFFVVMDATAPRKSMRDLARDLIDNFAEIHIDCSLETAMKRESRRPDGPVMAGLYKKALERKETGKEFPGLGQVIGVDIPFEKDPKAEMTIKNDDLTLDQAVNQALEYIIKNFST